MFFFFFQNIEAFVEEMFQYLKIKYEKEVAIKGRRIDFILKGTNNLDILVETKEARNNTKDIITSATNQLRFYKSIYPKEKLNKYSFVIIFGNISKKEKDYFKKENIIIIDISNIIYLIKNNQDLVEKLKNILPFSIIDIEPQKIDLRKYMGYVKNSKEEKSPYEMYYDFKEAIFRLPSHRILAMNRGEKEKQQI